MEKVIIVRYEEIFLKGLNRSSFEAQLIRNIKHALKGEKAFRVIKSQSRIYIEPDDDGFDFEAAITKVIKVFGIISVSPVHKVETDYDVIRQNCVNIVKELIDRKKYKTFKVETKRADKSFPMKSPDVSRDLGGHLLENVTGISVNVHDPDFILHVEIRESTYIYSEIIPAYGGLPVGSGGRALLLLSGGIDSPAAGWMIAKRGVELEAVHFYSYPYTSERSKDKVIKLTEILSQFCKSIKLHIVPFTDAQLEINQRCPQDHLTIIMRRIMMKIAEKIAEKSGAQALITGESIGQVASQTMEALTVTNKSVNMPVFRPLIGMDKREVVEIAKKIKSYETSILPYEDCCTVFVAKHPRTKPTLEETMKYESVLNVAGIVEKAVSGTEVLIIGH